MAFLRIGWEEAAELCEELARRIDFTPDIIIGISRGGLVPARILSDALGIKRVAILGMAFYRRISEKGTCPEITQELGMDVKGNLALLVDDVSDSGKSLLAAKAYLEGLGAHVKTATMHQKPGTTLVPDYCASLTSDWIVYPWERHEVEKEMDGD